MYHYQLRNVHVWWSIVAQHSSTRSLDTPITKRRILSLGLNTKEKAYLDNLMNLKEYSWTVIPPWWRFMYSSTFASRFSLGKNLSINAIQKTSQFVGPVLKHYCPSIDCTKFEPHPWVHKSAFSFEIIPRHTISYIPQESLGIFIHLRPKEHGGFILMKSIKWEAILLALWFIRGATSQFSWDIIAWVVTAWGRLVMARVKFRKSSLFFPIRHAQRIDQSLAN